MNVYVIRVNGTPYIKFDHKAAFTMASVFRFMLPDAIVKVARVPIGKKPC